MEKEIGCSVKSSEEDMLNQPIVSLLSDALKAICLTRDYVGEGSLPAIKGWTWYDVGTKIADKIPSDTWAVEFRKRVNQYKSRHIRTVFKDGDWVFGIGDNVGCSMVFTGGCGDMQPFSYLNDYDPKNFRLATKKEIRLANELLN